MQWGGGVGLLWGSLTCPVPVGLALVMQREVGLLEVSSGFRGVLWTPVAVIMRMWSTPDLALLHAPGWTLVLVAEGPLSASLVGQPASLFRKVTVVAPSTHVVMWMAPNLCPDWRGCLVGCPRGVGLLNGTQTNLTHAMGGCVTPGSFGHVFLVQWLFLPQRRREPTALCSSRENFWTPGQFRVHGRGPTMWMPLMLLPVKGV